MKAIILCVLLSSGWALGEGEDAANAERKAVNQDPFADGPASSMVDGISPERTGQDTSTLSVRCEIFEVPTLKAIRLLDETEGDAQASSLREKMLSAVESGEARVLESAAMRMDAGLAGTFEGICEMIYPTEYDYDSDGLEGMSLEKPEDPESPSKTAFERFMESISWYSLPTAFETRNSGFTLEVKVQHVQAEPDSWDVSWAPELVELLKERTWLQEAVAMPYFGTWRMNGSFRVTNGQWVVAGMAPKPSPDGGTEPDTRRIAFLKVTKVR